MNSGTGYGKCRRKNEYSSPSSASFESDSNILRELRTRPAMNLPNSSDTSTCLDSNRPWTLIGPTITGSAGSNNSLIAIQLVTYPTTAPATGKVHGFGFTTHATICNKPNKNPKPNPLSTKKSSSTRPTFWNKSTKITLSRTNASNTTARRSNISSISICNLPTTCVNIRGKNGCSILTQTSPYGSFLNSSSTIGINKDANSSGSIRPNASVTVNNRSVTM
mmetsp:Transcript_16554/g.27033  ORF Transcript_16554/g.27033 Transcript_16554/m.27033 type:complete len:221 (+) Transcript_16554:670-1332(+)